MSDVIIVLCDLMIKINDKIKTFKYYITAHKQNYN